jgi:hypothetical protein
MVCLAGWPPAKRAIEGRLVFRWAALGHLQERGVDRFDVDATFLNGLDAVSDLDQLASGLFRVGVGAGSREYLVGPTAQPLHG